MRITTSCVSLHNTPSCFSASQNGRAGLFSSMPIHSPLPRTSLICGLLQALQLLQEVVAQLGRALDQLLFHQHSQRRARHRAAQRIAAKRAAVIPGMEHAQHFFRRQHRRHRIEAAGQRLADDHRVGPNAFVLKREQLAGAAQARLDFVRDQAARGSSGKSRRHASGIPPEE